MSVFSHYPEVWDEALHEEVVNQLESWGMDDCIQCFAALLRDEYPDTYQKFVEEAKIDPTERAYERMAGV